MKETMKALHNTLTEMMATISAGGSTAGGSIAEHLATIDHLAKELGAGTPAMLRHYLEKRSYAKALDFLEGRDETSEAAC
jgi:hypothetical protein